MSQGAIDLISEDLKEIYPPEKYHICVVTSETELEPVVLDAYP